MAKVVLQGNLHLIQILILIFMNTFTFVAKC
nr:MAG TPA: hypothetical protein [Caudoviricetes sp.]